MDPRDSEVVAEAGSSRWHLFFGFGVLPLPRCDFSATFVKRLVDFWWLKMGGFTGFTM